MTNLPPVLKHGRAIAQHAAAGQHHAGPLPVGAGGALGGQRRAADEIPLRRLPVHGPAQAAFERRDGVVHVVAVQGQAGFQPQRVARAKPRRAHAGLQQRLPQGRRGGRRQHDFVAVLAGIAGATDQPLALLRRGKARQTRHARTQGSRQQRISQRARLRSLHRQHGQVVAWTENHVEAGLLCAQPGQIGFPAGGIEHQPKPIGAEAVDQQVIDDAGLFVQQAGVQRLAAGDARDIAAQHPAQVVVGLRATQVRLRHVRHVEHAGAGAHRVVFIQLRAVMQRHVPAGKRRHAGTGGQVQGMQGRFQEQVGGHGRVRAAMAGMISDGRRA